MENPHPKPGTDLQQGGGVVNLRVQFHPGEHPHSAYTLPRKQLRGITGALGGRHRVSRDFVLPPREPMALA